MRLIDQTVQSASGDKARLSGYVIDNSKEMDLDRVRPTVLICPGGGYAFLSDREAEPVAEKIVGMGYNAFILRYSVAPVRYPAAFEQAAAAMALLRANACEWNIDSHAIVIGGFSAGGHVAAGVATMWNKSLFSSFDAAQIRPDGLMLGYPVITSGKFAHEGSFKTLLGDKFNDPEMLRKVSLEYMVDEKTPTTFLWHTMTDDTVPVENSTLFALACKNHDVPVEAHLYPHGGHGLSLGTKETAIPNGYGVEECIQSWVGLFHEWMKRNFPVKA